MSDDTLLDELLDEWESQLNCAGAPSLEAFIEKHCAGASDDLRERFRRRAQALAAMDRKLAAAGDGPAPPSQRDANPRSDLLRPGWEPLPGYRLEERRGRGGFGEVWKATAPGGFHVALKFVRLQHRVGEAELRALQVIKDLRHPHLLSVFGAWQEHGYLIVAMELAERTLAERFEEATAQAPQAGIPREELLRYFGEAAKGLDFLNKPSAGEGGGGNAGVQHRDIKPQNLLLVGGSVKVGDFGLARVLEHSLTGHTGSMTVAYAPPEFFGRQTSTQSDQYSLAVTWCELRGGRLPFTGSQAQLMAGHLNEPPDLSMLPPEERPVVARALAKKPPERWPTCGEFVESLRQATTSTTPHARPGPERRRVLSRKWMGIGAAIIGLAAVLAFLLMTRPRNNGNFAPPQPGGQAEGPLNPGGEVGGPLTLAVLDFDNHSREESLDGFRLGFRDMLVTDLVRVRAVQVVERSRVQAVLDEQHLAKGAFIDPATASRIGKGIAARALVLGSYLISGDQIRVDVRLLSVETGEIQFADTVTGTRKDVFGLQRTLAAKVLAGLGVKVQEQDRQALGQAQTRDFEAFRLYGEALQALSRDRQQEAEDRLRKALARDPDYRPALRELATIEIAALTRLAEDDKARLAKAGQVGRALANRAARLREGVTGDKRGADFFAGLIALSAHAGLLGNTSQEKALLGRYWKEFALRVPPEQSSEMAEAVRRSVAGEGKFFQEQVDGGDYSTFLEDFSKPEDFLKPELRAVLQWPRYAVIWPFDFDSREAFRIVNNDQGVKVDPSHFEKTLPRHAHEYLRKLLADDTPQGMAAALKLRMEVVRYYARWKTGMPADLARSLAAIHEGLLTRLGRKGPEAWEPVLVREAVPALEAVATLSPDDEMRRRGNTLLAQYARHARFNETGKSEPAPRVTPVSVPFCTLKVQGPRVAFLVDLDDEVVSLPAVYVQKQLDDAIRALPDGTRLNVLLSGSVAKAARPRMFDGMRELNGDTRREASAFIEAIPKSRDLAGTGDGGHTLAASLESVLKDWPKDEAGKGEVCVICSGNSPQLPAGLVSRVRRNKAGHPKILLVGRRRVEVLGRLARDSGGAAVLLVEGELLNVEAKPWDVSKIK